MEPYFLMMIIGGGVFFIFDIIAMVNFMQMLKSRELRKGMGTHMICGFVSSFHW